MKTKSWMKHKVYNTLAAAKQAALDSAVKDLRAWAVYTREEENTYYIAWLSDARVITGIYMSRQIVWDTLM